MPAVKLRQVTWNLTQALYDKLEKQRGEAENLSLLARGTSLEDFALFLLATGSQAFEKTSMPQPIIVTPDFMPNAKMTGDIGRYVGTRTPR